MKAIGQSALIDTLADALQQVKAKSVSLQVLKVEGLIQHGIKNRVRSSAVTMITAALESITLEHAPEPLVQVTLLQKAREIIQ